MMINEPLRVMRGPKLKMKSKGLDGALKTSFMGV